MGDVVLLGSWTCKFCSGENTNTSICHICAKSRNEKSLLFEPDARHLFAGLDELLESNKNMKIEDVVFQRKHKLDEGDPEMQEFLGAHDLIEKAVALKSKARRFANDDPHNSSSILDSSNYNIVKVQEQIEAFVEKESTLPSTDVTNVTGFITLVTDNILQNQILDATGRLAWSNVEREVYAASDDWAQQEWESFRTKFMNGLGHRTHKLENIQKKVHMEVNSTRIGQADALGVLRGNVVNFDGRLGNAPVPAAVAGGNWPGGGPAALGPAGLAAGGRAQSPQHGLHLSRVQHAHCAVVNRVSHYRRLAAEPAMQDAIEFAIRPAKEFGVEIQAAIVSSLNEQDNLSRKDLVGYRDLMDMLSEVAGENEALNGELSLFREPFATYSPICFEKAWPDGDADKLIDDATKADLAHHAKLLRKYRLQLTHRNKHYLEHQLWMTLSGFVDGAVLRGEMTVNSQYDQGGRASRQKIRAYVRIRDNLIGVGGAAQLRSPLDNFQTPVWPCVYYLLKIGDLDGAIIELRACASYGLDVLHEVIIILEIYRKLVTELHIVGIANGQILTVQELALLRSSLEVVVDAFNHSQEQPDFCAFRYFVYGLLCLEDETMIAEAKPEFADAGQNASQAPQKPEIEHTLWVHLWHVQWRAILCDYCSMMFSDFQEDLPDNGEGNVYQAFADAGGERCFDTPPGAADSEPSVFTYAKVLFACQRFGDAIEYLWRKNKIFPAIHLSIVCLHYGLILPYRPLISNPPLFHGASTVCPADILREYTSCPFALDYPKETADYMMCLRSQWKEKMPASVKNAINADENFWNRERIAAENVLSREFAYIFTIMDKAALDKVCGQVSGTVRVDGYIDQFFDRHSVRALLSEAAKHMRVSKGDAISAIRLHKLAENYGEVLEELNNQLCSTLTPPHTKMKFWFEAATQYRTDVVPHVVDVLLANDEDEQISILDSMLHLCNFMTYAADGSCAQALNTLDQVHIPTPGCILVPKSSDRVLQCAGNMNSLTRRAPNIESSLRTAMNDILLVAMNCAHVLHDECKRSVIHNPELVNDMYAYRDRADSIIEFSGKIVLRIDTLDKLQQIGDRF